MVGVGSKPLEVHLGPERLDLRAYAVAPLVEHHLRAENVGLVGACVEPDHPHYRRFRRIGEKGLLALDPKTFTGLECDIAAACAGHLDIGAARALFDGMIAIVAEVLPVPKPLDPRIRDAMDILRSKPNYSLTQLAADVGLSYHRISRLFSESIGLSIRSYQLWKKMLAVAPLLETGHTLVDVAEKAGFTDVSHLCRVYREAFGAPPSYIHSNDRIRYVSYRMPGAPADEPARSRTIVAA
jgi:AraC-like DNA-binding protein